MSHQPTSWAEIDLGRLRANMAVIRHQVGLQTKILAVIKANAYGHGMDAVAIELAAAGTDYFGVATIAEGIRLQRLALAVPVLVMRSVPVSELADLLDAGLVPSISSLEAARAAHEYGRRHNCTVKVHVRIDTAHDDDGWPAADSLALFEILASLSNLDVEGLYTHLSTAYGYDRQLFQNQLDCFSDVLGLADRMGLAFPLVHAASSPAVFGFPQSHFNMVRVGTALYGLPFVHDESCSGLQPVMQIKSRVTCVKYFPEPCLPGYGQVPLLHDEGGMHVAYISVGYADLPFLLIQKDLQVLLHGRPVRLYGLSHMDYIKVDVSQIPSAVVPGDEVVLLGHQDQQSIDAWQIARACDLSRVHCESVCFLGERMTRHYEAASQAASPVAFHPGQSQPGQSWPGQDRLPVCEGGDNRIWP